MRIMQMLMVAAALGAISPNLTGEGQREAERDSDRDPEPPQPAHRPPALTVDQQRMVDDLRAKRTARKLAGHARGKSPIVVDVPGCDGPEMMRAEEA